MRKTSKLFRKYMEYRKDGSPAKIAHHWAKQRAPLALDWQGEVATLRRAGFDIRIKFRIDNGADLSHLGEFTSSPARGAEFYRVDPDNVPGRSRDWPRDEQGRAVCYYVPMNTAREARAWFKAHGYAAHIGDCIARSYIKRDAERLAKFYSGDLQCYVVTVTASRNGIELGADSLGGIDVDKIAELDACISDHGMIDQAISEASASVAALCHCKRARGNRIAP